MSISERIITAHRATGTGRQVREDVAIAYGLHTTVDENDTIVTGLSRVDLVVATFEEPPVIGATLIQADRGDQAGSPAAGSFNMMTYKPTATGNATPTAASTFGKEISWIAIGAA